MTFDEIFDLTARVYLFFDNIARVPHNSFRSTWNEYFAAAAGAALCGR